LCKVTPVILHGLCKVTPVILHGLCKVTPVILHGVVSPEMAESGTLRRDSAATWFRV